MRSIFKRILFITIAVLAINTVSAQKKKAKKNSDYVITANGDTLLCVITTNFFGKYSYETAGDTAQVLSPVELKEYHLRNKNEFYRSVIRTGESKPVFLKAIEKGKISLFNDPVPNEGRGGLRSVWYISKNSNSVAELRLNKTSLNDFAEMIKDNKDVYAAYLHDKDKKENYDQLRSLIRLYNTGEWVQTWPKGK